MIGGVVIGGLPLSFGEYKYTEPTKAATHSHGGVVHNDILDKSAVNLIFFTRVCGESQAYDGNYDRTYLGCL